MQGFISLEQTLGRLIGRILATPYNWSLVGLTILWGSLIYCFGFWNTNFDMVSTMTNYIMLSGVAVTVVGLLMQGELSSNLTRLGVLTQFVTMLAIFIAKSVATSRFGVFIIPLSMFCFLLLLKNIWLMASAKVENKVTA